MPNKQYRTTWAKIGNASGFRMSAGFFKDYPRFKEAEGAVEVIAPNTLLVRLQPREIEQQEEELMLSLYLNFLTEQALLNPEEVEAYTEEMVAEDEELMAGVEIEDEWSIACDR